VSFQRATPEDSSKYVVLWVRRLLALHLILSF
jgi:hypothetical protein